VVALARDLYFLGSRLLTRLPAVFVTRLRHASAWQMRALDLLSRSHRVSPFPAFCFAVLIFIFSSGLPSSHHPADQCARSDTDCERGRNRQQRVSLESVRCLIQEFFGSITALLRRTLHHPHAIFDRIANRTGYARRLAG
jgi:hypothetical protein